MSAEKQALARGSRYQVSRMHGQYLRCWTDNDMGLMLQEVQAGEYPKWKNTADFHPIYRRHCVQRTPRWWKRAGAQLCESADRRSKWFYPRARASGVTPVQHMPMSANPGLSNRGDQVWVYHLPWIRGKSPNLPLSWEGSHKGITRIYKIQCQPWVTMTVVDLTTAAVSMCSLEGGRGSSLKKGTVLHELCVKGQMPEHAHLSFWKYWDVPPSSP
jgi:hypothetical protein